MASVGENRGDGLARIADYINQLQFKKAVVGGIAQESAYQAMRDLVSIFTEVYTQETEHSAQLEAQMVSLRAEVTRANQEAENWKAQAQRMGEESGAEMYADPTLQLRVTELERERDNLQRLEAEARRALEQSEAKVGKLETENAVLRQQLVQPETGFTDMMEEVKLQLEERETKIRDLTAQKDRLEQEAKSTRALREQIEAQLGTLRGENGNLQKENHSLSAENLRLREQLLSAQEADVQTRRALEAKAQAEERLERQLRENEKLQEQLSARDDYSTEELGQIQSKAQELNARLMKAEEENRSLTEQLRRVKEQAEEASFQHETLEQIYLDANRRRKETVDAANAQAESILRASEAEVRKRKQQLEGEAAEARAQMEREQQEFRQKQQQELEQFEQQRTQAQERYAAELEQHKQDQEQLLEKAKEDREALLSQARADADKLIADAQEQAEECRIQAENLVQSANSTYKKERARYEDLLHRLAELRASAMRGIQEDMNRFQAMAFELSNSSMGEETRALVGLDQMDDLQHTEPAPETEAPAAQAEL